MIRPPQVADISRLAEIHVYGWRFAYRGVVPDRELYVERTVGDKIATWKQWLEHGVQAFVWDDGILKGFVMHGDCRDEDVVGAHEVFALYVEPDFARQGVGRVLMGAAETTARQLGKIHMKLWVLELNPIGRGFYEKQGYTADGGIKVIEEWAGARELRYTKAL